MNSSEEDTEYEDAMRVEQIKEEDSWFDSMRSFR